MIGNHARALSRVLLTIERALLYAWMDDYLVYIPFRMDRRVRADDNWFFRTESTKGGISFQSNGEKGEIFDQLDIF